MQTRRAKLEIHVLVAGACAAAFDMKHLPDRRQQLVLRVCEASVDPVRGLSFGFDPSDSHKDKCQHMTVQFSCPLREEQMTST
ncbi:unnamed protein product [Chondrus crispus]|uniref:Uncharacterized protein n=1 Tax=Chondrus crispus TaxID=2769 RepID=R7QCX6_CHOCR|nr:unnamed protein product [Chondrus crispus]CDF35286.1 unnamed protein product [Chondrus crispus]|eukprot:XP_005715105.1 unnamed protein product [Chondrus crispus]